MSQNFSQGFSHNTIMRKVIERLFPAFQFIQKLSFFLKILLTELFELWILVWWQYWRIDPLLGHEWFNEHFSELLVPLLPLFHTVKPVGQIIPHRELFKVFDHNRDEQIQQDELPKNQNNWKKHRRADWFCCPWMILVNLRPSFVN